MVYLAAPYPSGNPGISCIFCIFCIFHHNLFRICSKIILISSCFEKSCCILKFDAVVVLSAFSHPCIPIIILLSSLHILWRFSSFPLFNVCSPLIYRGWPYLEEAGLTFATALTKQASEEENNLTLHFLILLFFHLFWGCVTISISTDKVQCVAQTLERENFDLNQILKCVSIITCNCCLLSESMEEKKKSIQSYLSLLPFSLESILDSNQMLNWADWVI